MFGIRPTISVIFYCHFPDQLLTKRQTFLKKLYRTPIDWIEEKTTGMADLVMVNSQFTKKVFYETFPSLAGRFQPVVVYPIPQMEAASARQVCTKDDSDEFDGKPFVFLSINRYERKKNIALAVEAIHELLARKPELSSKVHLVIAGGYDERLMENRQYFQQLKQLVDELNMSDYVTFCRSISAEKKQHLMDSCFALIYTPENEHFGIVPVEAMHTGRPVIAANSGGPLETVLNGTTGFLSEPTAGGFADAAERLVSDRKRASAMGMAGKKRAAELFTFVRYGDTLAGHINSLLHSE